MLVLSRRFEAGKDSITIRTPDGYAITVKLSRVCKSTGTVRLAFDAVPEVKIVRNEILRPPTGQFESHPFTADALVLQEVV